MTIHRFFVDESLFASGEDKIILSREVSDQIRKVLRLKTGDTIVLCDGKGNEYISVILNLMQNLKGMEKRIGNNIPVEIIEKKQNQNEPTLHLTLYQSLIPREKFEDVLQKCTEIGVSKFVPLETERCQIHAKDIREDKIERWQKIIKEAAEQSERGIVPQVTSAMKFEKAIDKAVEDGKVLVAWEREYEKSPIPNPKPWSSEGSQINFSNQASIFIGPEGGFSDAEIAFAKEKGAKTISLGPRILRSETAGIVASSMFLLL